MANKTILVADDSVIMRELIRHGLRKLPVDLVEASTGNETIRQINKYHPDLILLDISMPGPDGLTILKHLRKDEEFSETPVVFMTVEGSIDCYNEAEILGVNGYFIKPIDLRMLQNRVRWILENKGVKSSDKKPLTSKDTDATEHSLKGRGCDSDTA